MMVSVGGEYIEWLLKLSNAIDYIEVNLDNEISYDKGANIACCSTYYFQRLFTYVIILTTNATPIWMNGTLKTGESNIGLKPRTLLITAVNGKNKVVLMKAMSC